MLGIFWLLNIHVSVGRATVYRCENGGSAITYQEIPCVEGRQQAVKIESTEGFNSKLSPAEQRRWQQMRANAAKLAKEKAEAEKSAEVPSKEQGSEKGQAERTDRAGERAFIRPGTPEHEVERRLGKPDKISKAHGEGASAGNFNVSQNVVAAGKKAKTSHHKRGTETLYVYYPTAKDPQTTTEVYMQEGKVSRVERRVTY